MIKITTSHGHQLEVGDVVTFPAVVQHPWYVRLWHWLLRCERSYFVVTNVGTHDAHIEQGGLSRISLTCGRKVMEPLISGAE